MNARRSASDQTSGRRASLHDPRDRIVRQPPRMHALETVQRAEHRAVGDARRLEPRLHRAHRARGWVGVCRPETPLMPAGRSWRPRTNAFAFATTAAKSVPALVPEAENLAARVEDPAGRHGSDGTLPGQKRHRGRTMTLPQPTRMIDRDTNQVSARAIVRHRARPAARAS